MNFSKAYAKIALIGNLTQEAMSEVSQIDDSIAREKCLRDWARTLRAEIAALAVLVEERP